VFTRSPVSGFSTCHLVRNSLLPTCFVQPLMPGLQSSPLSLSSLIVSLETTRENFCLYLQPMFIQLFSYYSLVEVIYEAFTLSAFLMLLIQFVASTASSHTAENALERKDKTRLPLPLCCWRFRPTKPYFMYTLKWSVMQYTIVRPGVFIFLPTPSVRN
jgi:Organic solute transporter Ostalpha